MRAVVNGRIVLNDKVVSGMVLLYDKRIVDVIPEDKLLEYDISKTLDANDGYVSAGFIDIHTHGAIECDVMDGNEKALKAISEKLPSFGVTGFLPTTMTMEWDKIQKALLNIKECMKNNSGARILGCNLEGPFISRKYCGAHIPEYIINPDFSLIEEYKRIIKLVTVAPELENSSAFIKKCSEEGIVVSVGHSDATNDIVKAAIDDGAKSTTHTFNAMSPLHHRSPGVVGAVLQDSSVYCELIADNIHVHPDVQRVLFKAKGIDRIILVTDSMRAAGMGKGVYELGGQTVLVDETSARLENGTLAGSILTLNNAVRNFMKNTGIEIYEAVKAVTVNPAKLIGIYDRKGSIESGKDADIVVFNENFEIQETIVEGELRFHV